MTTMALATITTTATLPATDPAVTYLARLGACSAPTMARCLATLVELAGCDSARRFPWHLLRYEHTAALRARLLERFKPATVNKHLAALRGTLREAFRLGQMVAEDYHRAVDLQDVRNETLPAGRELGKGELADLFDACGRSAQGRRDAALLALLYGCGLRRAEAAELELADFDAVSGGLRVRGKGRKERMVYVLNGTRAAVEAWLLERGREPGPLLCRVRRGGHVGVERLSLKAVHDILERVQDAAGVADFSAHDLRRSFVSHLLDAGADLPAVQRLAGHANPRTTARYDRRGERAQMAAAGLLAVPFQA